MATNPDFDWDEVIVSKKPKQKEIDVTFTSDPDLTLGSIEQEDVVERPVSSTGLTECGQQDCNSAENYANNLPYDVMQKGYGVRDQFFTFDVPSAVRFRITDEPQFDGSYKLDNFLTYNASARYRMIEFPLTTARTPCEAFYDRQELDATFLNASPNGTAAFYPREFEDFAGFVFNPGDSVRLESMFGQMIWGRLSNGAYTTSPDPDRSNLGYMRIMGWGKNSSTGQYDGANAGNINVGLASTIITDSPGTASAEVSLVGDSIDWNVIDPGTGYPVQEQKEIRLDDYSNGQQMPLGDQTGAYMCKLTADLDLSQDGNSFSYFLKLETEHVVSGRKITQTISGGSSGMNGGFKMSSPWEYFPNGDFFVTAISPTANAVKNSRGGMEATTRYWSANNNSKKCQWLIAYDRHDNEAQVRKACWEMERSRPSWSVKEYCSRVL